MKTAIYLRISLDASGDGLAIERQREDCLRIVKERGWTVHEEYVDSSLSASDKNTKRPAYDRMSEDFAAGHFKALVCWDLDRLTRQPRQLEDWIDAAEDRGLKLVTANGEADLTNEAGILFAGIKAQVARAEVRRKGDRQKRANQQRAEKGLPAPGRRPFGYENGGLKVRESEAVYLRELYRTILNGGSLKGLARKWNDSGLKSPQGGAWTSIQLKRMANRERNAGLIVREGVIYPSEHIEPIVSREEFDQAVAILKSRGYSRSGREPLKHWLTGIATCGVCGAPMGGKSTSEPGKSERVARYLCSTRKDPTHSGDTRRHPAVTAAMIEPVVIKELAGALLFGQSRDDMTKEVEHLRDRIKALQSERADTAALIRDGLLSAADARPVLEKLKTEEAALLIQLEASDNGDDVSALKKAFWASVGRDKRVSISGAGAALRELSEGIHALPVDQRRALARALLIVTVNTGRGPKRIIVERKEEDVPLGGPVSPPEAI